MNKINFTSEHEADLKALFLELGFTGEFLQGKFGANEYTVWDCIHNLQISTLKNINVSLKKEIAALEDLDEWSSNSHQIAKANKLRKWQKFVSLCVGYKINTEQKAEEAKKNREAKAERLATLKGIIAEAEIAELKKLSVEELNKQIEALHGDLF